MWLFSKKPTETINVGKGRITLKLKNGVEHAWDAKGYVIGNDYVTTGTEAAHEMIQKRMTKGGMFFVYPDHYVPVTDIAEIRVTPSGEHLVEI